MEPYISGDAEGFTPEEYEDIVLCLQTLFSIRAGEQPLDRELGIDYEKVISKPVPVAQNMIALEIVEKTEIYEPRVRIDSVKFKSENDGQLIPIVHFVKRRD